VWLASRHPQQQQQRRQKEWPELAVYQPAIDREKRDRRQNQFRQKPTFLANRAVRSARHALSARAFCAGS
jgi:hypothetical protein